MLSNFNLTGVFVNKGFNENPAVQFRKNESNETTVATFGVSGSVFDSKAENKKRYVNFACKAFGDVAQRIEKMKVDAGANINIAGNLDVDSWEKDGEKKSRVVLIVRDIEFVYHGKKKDGETEAEAPSGATVAAEDDEVFDDLPF